MVDVLAALVLVLGVLAVLLVMLRLLRGPLAVLCLGV
jgi:hypothetical protein